MSRYLTSPRTMAHQGYDRREENPLEEERTTWIQDPTTRFLSQPPRSRPGPGEAVNPTNHAGLTGLRSCEEDKFFVEALTFHSEAGVGSEDRGVEGFELDGEQKRVVAKLGERHLALAA